jgi:acyl-CoA reductase-like NAD-dependent aldehyde dehydrogenase
LSLSKLKELNMSINDINNMSIAERMYLMEQLWDSFKQNENELASPAWHETVLTKRKKRYENGELQIFSLNELRVSFNR